MGLSQPAAPRVLSLLGGILGKKKKSHTVRAAEPTHVGANVISDAKATPRSHARTHTAPIVNVCRTLMVLAPMIFFDSQDQRHVSEIRANQFNSEGAREHADEEPGVSSNRLSEREDGRTLSGFFFYAGGAFVPPRGESSDGRLLVTAVIELIMWRPGVLS